MSTASLRARRVGARVAAVVSALAVASVTFVASPAPAAATDPVTSMTDAEGTRQIVMSKVRTFSLIGTPETGWSTATAFEVAATTDLNLGGGLQSTTDEDGAAYIRLSRRYPGYDFSDSNFNASWQYNAANGNINWGAQLSSSLRGIASSPVAEQTYWWINNGSGGHSHHVQSPYYHFHGTMPNVGPGDTVDFASEYTFECHGGRATCIATLYASFYIVD